MCHTHSHQVQPACLHEISHCCTLQCNEPEQVAGNENHYVNGPEASACEGTQRDRDAPVAAADCAVAEEVIPANFISFGWQIASGMVKTHSQHLVSIS